MILRCDLAYCILSGLARLSRRRNGLTSFCCPKESDDENHFAVEHGRCSAVSSMDSRAFREIIFLNFLRASIPPSRRNYPKNGKISYFVELTRFESLTRLPGCRRAFFKLSAEIGIEFNQECLALAESSCELRFAESSYSLFLMRT